MPLVSINVSTFHFSLQTKRKPTERCPVCLNLLTTAVTHQTHGYHMALRVVTTTTRKCSEIRNALFKSQHTIQTNSCRTQCESPVVQRSNSYSLRHSSSYLKLSLVLSQSETPDCFHGTSPCKTVRWDFQLY